MQWASVEPQVPTRARRDDGLDIKDKVALVGKRVVDYKFTKNVASLITNAFGLIAALAWSDAIKGLLKGLGTFSQWPFAGPFIQAVLVTAVAYFVSVTVGKLSPASCTKLCTQIDT